MIEPNALPMPTPTAMPIAMPVAILGGGGHARVVIEALHRAGETILGVIDPKPGVTASLPSGISYLGATLQGLRPDQADLAIGVGSVDIAGAERRARLFAEAKAAGFGFRRVVHPETIVPADAVLGEGSQIMAGAILQPRVVLGANCIVNTGSRLDHDCQVGDHTHLAPGAVLSGDVRIGDRCHIGTGAIIIQGIRIGAGSMIAAGAVITRNLEAGAKVSPASRG
jgi:UDP-perosamine 4-acetyltransferase